MNTAVGFIVSAWDERRPGRGETGRLLMTGRLTDGRSFAALRAKSGSALFVPRERSLDAAAALAAAGEAELGTGVVAPPADWEDMEGRPLSRFTLACRSTREAERVLAAAGVPVLGVDRLRADEELASMGIRGRARLRGEEVRGRRVDTVFLEPELEPDASTEAVPLRWLALDIETDREERVVAVSLVTSGGEGTVLFVQGRGRSPGSGGIEVFPDEASLLGALSARVAALDPDVVTGWNVIDFDFRVLVARYAALGLAFDAGRSEEPVSFVEARGRKAALDLPGRAVLDAMRLMRGSGARFEDLTLETVAREVLGEGKSVSSRGRTKIEELEALRARDPDAFCAYCLRDSELVLRILEKTGLDELTARRAALTGVSLDLAWTSIPAFERVYGAALRSRHIAVPAKTDRSVSGAAGGTVLEARAGLFRDVLVLDFRSLYPSIMRTFNVDPLAYARAQSRMRSEDLLSRIAPNASQSASMEPRSGDIVAPNGARFDRRPGIMPELIAEYATERERALAAGDEVAAYVYKILQNSFYGVLGADSCRYARTEIAGAITSFGKKFLTMSRDFFEERGFDVLYGDTDSVFVLSGIGAASGKAELFEKLMGMGRARAEELNAAIAQRVKEEYGLPSLLRIRCEKAYAQFLIPRLKSEGTRLKSEAGEGSGRGRSKGYAGLLLAGDGSSSVEVKGMEAARTDFTPLARDFQVALLELAFSGAGEDALRDFARAEAAALERGERDDRLVYRKTLRREAEAYSSETPQVRAARLLGWTSKRGRVSYVMTKAGAEPVEEPSGAGLDYGHYIEHQLAPIALSIADALGYDARTWFETQSQFELDFG